MADAKKKKKKKKKKSGNSNTAAIVILVVLLLVLFGALFFLVRVIRYTAASSPDPTPSISAVPTLSPSQLSPDGFGLENGYKTYSSPSISAVLGIDVSSHQGYIDWQAVADSGVDYAILQVGYRGYGDGSIHQDETFEFNITAAKAAGLSVGVYFFSQALSLEEAEAEAHTVLSLIDGHTIEYPVYFDWEPVENARSDTISSSELTACAKRFCQTIEEAGYRAGVYFNLSLATRYYQLYELKDYAFWLADYQEVPSFPFYFGMWQYTDGGTVPGISASVDLNLAFTYDN